MSEERAERRFTEGYACLFAVAREDRAALPEHVVQCVWYDQLFSSKGLATADGMPLRIVSPGWWNHEEGPDFKGAQIRFGDTLRTGDVEVHLDHGAWKQHGHHTDPRYDDVLLVVVLTSRSPFAAPVTSGGRPIACLLLADYLETDLFDLSKTLAIDDYPYAVNMTSGYCAGISSQHGPEHVLRFLHLAGEWRLLHKARSLRERMERVGPDQAIYEMFLAACGYSRFKYHFQTVARQLPYERVAQLARQDPLLVETALLQIAGLLPEALPDAGVPVAHFDRLAGLRKDYLTGLKSLPLTWPRTGVRPNNFPERRLAGAARFLARMSRDGLAATLDAVWREDATPLERRRALETLFPNAMGFWAEHCTWTGKKLPSPNAPLGANRIRSIIGNVVVPAGLASARLRRSTEAEERVHAFYAALPKDAGNRIVKIMTPRVFGEAKPPRVDFRAQQGLIQVYQDWCEPNPSCRNCPVIPYLEHGGLPPSTD